MKIGYFADGIWAHNAIERISSNSDFEIQFITPRYDTQDPVLKKWSEKLNVDFLILENINDKNSISLINEYSPDILVSMSYNQIFKNEIIDLPPLGVINCHAGALPFYRGRNILNWALINNENEFGVTAHYIDTGIDTGDIILQKKYQITDRDDYGTLLDRASLHCADILYDALMIIHSGKVDRIAQESIDKVGSYCPMRKEGDEWINFQLSSRDVFNFIRGITFPGPLAVSKLNDEKIFIRASKSLDNESDLIGTSGEIVRKNHHSITVKTGSGLVEFLYIDLLSSNIIGAKNLISDEHFEVGMKFTSEL